MVRDIINYTTITEKIRLRINIGIAYDADMQTAKDIILNVADSAEWVAKEPPPVVVVRNFGDSSVDLQLRGWIDDARKRMRTISTITEPQHRKKLSVCWKSTGMITKSYAEDNLFSFSCARVWSHPRISSISKASKK